MTKLRGKKIVSLLMAVVVLLTFSIPALAIVSAISAGIPVYAADSMDEMTTREKILQMVGREPDCYVVLLDDSSVEVSEAEFYAVADDLKNGTFDAQKYQQRMVSTESFEEPTLYEEYYDFSTHSVTALKAITETITPHTINAQTTMWYGTGYYMNREGLLTFEIDFSVKPSNTYAVLKKNGTQTNSDVINSKNYVTAYIAGSAGTYNPGVKNLGSSSISVTGGKINCAA